MKLVLLDRSVTNYVKIKTKTIFFNSFSSSLLATIDYLLEIKKHEPYQLHEN